MSNINNVQSMQMVTIFRLAQMTLRVVTSFAGNDIHDQSSHAPIFQELQEKLTPLTLTMIHEVDKVLEAVESIQAVTSVEISNPANGNGFIVNFNRSI